ncbi:acyltransferase [Aeromonas jandaei]|uniref:acyltransferase n=1 Tax=Aeromonas jandaei TaxID=650 RepID=UPI003EC58455
MPVKIEKQVVIGTNSVVFPGVTIGEGCAIGAMSLLLKSTASWGIYIGNPAYRLKERDRNIARLESDFLKEINNEHSI